MKRRVLQIIVLLVLGAIVNVAVAWGCSLLVFSNPTSTTTGSLPLDEDEHGVIHETWHVDFFQLPTLIAITSQRMRLYNGLARSSWNDLPTPYDAVPSWATMIRTPDVPTDPSQPPQQVVFARGWPLVSFWCDVTVQPRRVRGGIDFGDSMGTAQLPRFLAYWPIWSHLAINTIFYAAMLGVVFFVPGMVKRRVRRRRGLCPACAYPVGTSPVCTECGASLPLPSGGEGEGRGEGA